jgi:hypothetical protein
MATMAARSGVVMDRYEGAVRLFVLQQASISNSNTVRVRVRVKVRLRVGVRIKKRRIKGHVHFMELFF